MARISEMELRRLKKDVSLARLAEVKGVQLKKTGDTLLGRCPFHEDKTPSFVVTPSKNLWHCLGACRTGGSVIDFVMKAEGVSFRHAVELLRNDAPLSPLPAGAVKTSSVRRLPVPVRADATDAQVMRDVVEYYHQALLASDEARAYLEKRGLGDEELLRHFQVGFANRTLGLRLPEATRLAGAELRGQLQRLGVMRESGHEHLAGSVVVPLVNEAGDVVGLYGRKVLSNLRPGTPQHLYLPGPHRAAFNSYALVDCKTVILCEAVLDAMSFWAAGYRAVLAAYGVDGFTPHHLEALKRHRVRSVLIAYDRDDAGDAAAVEVAAHLKAEGFDCWRVLFPRGMDANEYAVKVQPAVKSLGVALRQAEWMGSDGAARPPPPLLPSKHGPASPLAALATAPSAPASTVALPGAQGERKVAVQASARVATVDGPAAPPAPEAPRRGWLVGAKPVVGAVAPPLNEAAPSAPASVMGAVAGTAGVGSSVGTTISTAPAPTSVVPVASAGALPIAQPAPGALPPVMALNQPAPPAPSPVMGTPASATSSATATSSAAGERSSAGPSLTDDEAHFTLGPRRYRLRGLLKPHTPDALRLNVLLTHGESPAAGLGPRPSTALGTGFHVDTFDLYSAKARAAFVAQAAAECGLDTDTVKRDVGHLLLQVEALLDKRREAAKGPQVPTLTEDERDEALAFLRSPQLLTRVLEDFGRCGVVGEETNKLVGYLAAVSRKLDEPLAVLIQSSSAAGKSSLMEAVLAFLPDEEKTKYSAMTGQSLFYMGDVSLRHKVLAVVEEEGASRASYALKLLQSEGELTIASTGKDPHTGRLVTHEYHVEGPTQLFLTTTAVELDEELLNRCLVLSVDEDRAQTKAIHQQQREKQTLEGLLAKREKEAVLALHQNAQRLLRPLAVVNPYARQLTFLDDRTRARRDFPKYLTLIRAIALLHQYQRPVKTAQHLGGSVEYVEVQPEDIATANRLAAAVLGRSLDELPPQTRRLLKQLEAYVAKREAEEGTPRAEVRFTRRELREALKWGDTQLHLHLGRLERLEYLASQRGLRGGFSFQLLPAAEVALASAGLTDVAALDEASTPAAAPTLASTATLAPAEAPAPTSPATMTAQGSGGGARIRGGVGVPSGLAPEGGSPRSAGLFSPRWATFRVGGKAHPGLGLEGVVPAAGEVP